MFSRVGPVLNRSSTNKPLTAEGEEPDGLDHDLSVPDLSGSVKNSAEKKNCCVLTPVVMSKKKLLCLDP